MENTLEKTELFDISISEEQAFNYKSRNFVVRVSLAYSISITDITDAQVRGKECYGISLMLDWDKQEGNWHGLMSEINQIELVDEMISYTLVDDSRYLESFKLYLNSTPAKNVWPATSDLKRFKPLTKVPKKWTMPHAIRAIVNEQYKANSLVNSGTYTDDYAFDASVNYQRGKRNPLTFAKELVKTPDGWKVYAAEGKVFINCHHFDNNSFIPVISQEV